MTRPNVNKAYQIKTSADLPCGTYGEALLLTETMEGWRSEKPIIDAQKCTLCNRCYMVCPEGVIFKNEKMEIDYRFCKGCGICAKECKKACITMVKEEEDHGNK